MLTTRLGKNEAYQAEPPEFVTWMEEQLDLFLEKYCKVYIGSTLNDLRIKLGDSGSVDTSVLNTVTNYTFRGCLLSGKSRGEEYSNREQQENRETRKLKNKVVWFYGLTN